MLQFLRERNADINQPDQEGNYPLHIAVTYPTTELARALVTAGSPLNCLNNKKESVKDVIDRQVTKEENKMGMYEVCKIVGTTSLLLHQPKNIQMSSQENIKYDDIFDDLSDISDAEDFV